MLRPSGDLGAYADDLQLPGEDLPQVGDQRLALMALASDALDYVFVCLRLEVSKCQVLELPLDLADAETVRKRRVDVQRLARDLAALDLGQGVEGAHVVKTVGELDEDDAEVLRHRHHHLADVLGLLLLVGPDGDAAQLGHALDQVRHLRTELLLDLVGGEGGVLHGVVEQRRGERLSVELEVGEDGGDLERVVDVVLPRQAPLAAVGRGGSLVRLADELAILGLEMVCDPEQL